MAVEVVGAVAVTGDGVTSVTVTLPSFTGPLGSGGFSESGISQTSAGTASKPATDGNLWAVVLQTNTNNLRWARNVNGPWYTGNIDPIGENQPSNSFTPRKIFYDNGVWVAVGDNSFSAAGQAAYSLDLITWYSSGSATDVGFLATGLYNIKYGNGYWVIAGGGNVYSMPANANGYPNGGPWTTSSLSSSLYKQGQNPMEYANGYWLIGGSTTNSQHATWYQASVPTGTWTSAAPVPWDQPLGITYENGWWVIGGQNGTHWAKNGTLPSGSGSTSGWTEVSRSGNNIDSFVYDPISNIWVRNTTSGFQYRSTPDSTTWTTITTGLTSGSFIFNSDNTNQWAGMNVYGIAGSDTRNPDILIASVMVRGGTGNTISTPSGWTALGTQLNNTTNISSMLFFKPYSNDTSATFTWSASNKATVILYALKGTTKVVPSSSYYATQAITTAATTSSTPSISSIPATQGLVITFFGNPGQDVYTYPRTAPTGYGYGPVNGTNSGAASSNIGNVSYAYESTAGSDITSVPSASISYANSQVYNTQVIVILPTPNVFAQALATIKLASTKSANAQANAYILTKGYGYAQSLGYSKSQNIIFGQALTSIGISTNLYTAIDETTPNDSDYIIASSLSSNYKVVIALSPLQGPFWKINHTLSYRASTEGTLSVNLYSAGVLISNSTVVSTPNLSTISIPLTLGQINLISDYSNLTVEFISTGGTSRVSWVQFSAPTPPTDLLKFGSGLSAAKISQTYYKSGQTIADILATSNVSAQAQVTLNGKVAGQSNSWIKIINNAYANSSSWIKVLNNNVYGQTNTDIKVTTVVYGQALTDIKTSANYLSANTIAYIKSTIVNNGQTQADILRSYIQNGQSQTDIKATYQVFGQSNARLLAFNVNALGLALSNIKGIGIEGAAQTQGYIKGTGRLLAQSQADILATSSIFGQALTDIKTTYIVSAQSIGYIKTVNITKFASSLTTIKTNYPVSGSSLADILATSNVYASTSVKILATYATFGQSQVSIKAVNYGFGLAQTAVRGTVFGQATVWIKVQSNNINGQANAKIILTSQYSAQSTARIKGMPVNTAQAVCLVYIPRLVRPTSDISNSGWIRVVR